MKRTLTAGERRTLTLGALAVAATLIGFEATPKWFASRTEHRDRLETVDRAAAESAALLRNLPALVDSLGARTEALTRSLDDYIVEASSEAAGAQLASIVSDQAARANVRLDAVSLAQDSTVEVDVRVVNANVTGSADVGGLTTWLAALEAGPPLIRIDALSLQQPLATASLNTPEELGFEISFSALHLLHVREALP